MPRDIRSVGAELRSVKTVILDQVTLYSEERVDAELQRHIKTSEWQRCVDSDALARRHILRMFGKSASVEMSCPASWWDHVKLALRTRWPKLFERLRIKMFKASASVGAVMTGLPPPTSKTRAIPYMVEPTQQQYATGGPFRDSEPPWDPNEESLERYVRDIASSRLRVDRSIGEVVVHPADFYEHCRASELRNYHAHVADRQSIPTVAGDVRLVIDPSQTRGVVGIP